MAERAALGRRYSEGKKEENSPFFGSKILVEGHVTIS